MIQPFFHNEVTIEKAAPSWGKGTAYSEMNGASALFSKVVTGLLQKAL